MAHIVDLTHFLVGPIERLQRPHRDDDPAAPAPPIGEGTHFSRVETDDLVDVENEDWAAALIEFDGGTVGSLEASRVDRRPARAACASRSTAPRGALALGASSA